MLKETRGAIYEIRATEQSKNAIFFWLIIGIIWIMIDNKINLFSIMGFLLFLPGIFIASFASMPLFLLKNKIALNIIDKKQERLASIIPVLKLLEIIEIIIAPIIYLKILSTFF